MGEPMDVGGGESPGGGIEHKWGGDLEDTIQKLHPYSRRGGGSERISKLIFIIRRQYYNQQKKSKTFIFLNVLGSPCPF